MSTEEFTVEGGRTLLAPSAEWITTEQAARVLNVTPEAFWRQKLTMHLRRKSRSLDAGKSVRGVGALWNAQDVAAAAVVRRVVGVNATTAAKFVRALRDGELARELAAIGAAYDDV